jgi:hypothetical protein
MAALLNPAYLRRLALPVHHSADLDRAIDRGGSNGGPRPAPLRPVASWHAGPSGRLTCIWTLYGDNAPS